MKHIKKIYDKDWFIYLLLFIKITIIILYIKYLY
jgi:hypothetical protein